MKNTIKLHRRYDEKDYQRLNSKGYTDQEIIDIWNKDILNDFMWLGHFYPKVVEKFSNQSNPNNNV